MAVLSPGSGQDTEPSNGTTLFPPTEAPCFFILMIGIAHSSNLPFDLLPYIITHSETPYSESSWLSSYSAGERF